MIVMSASDGGGGSLYETQRGHEMGPIFLLGGGW